MKVYERGQATLLILVLTLAVVLVVSLSIVSKTITNIRTTTEEETSQRAFSAAEAGIERALQQDGNQSGSFENNTTYQASISTLTGTEFVLNNSAPVIKDDGVDLWLSNYPDYTSPWTGTLTVYWGSSSDSCTTDEATNSMAAIELLLITGTKANPQLSHYALDPCVPPAGNRASVNRFEPISGGGGTVQGKTFAYSKTITVTSGLLMRVMTIYAPTIIGIKGCDSLGGGCTTLPSQGRIITSLGVSDNTQRKIVGFQENPKLPTQLFPFIIFAPR